MTLDLDLLSRVDSSPECRTPVHARRRRTPKGEPMRTLLIVALTIVAAVPTAAQTRPKALEGIHRVVCLGDSITQAGGQPGGYVWLLERYLNTLYGDRATPASTTIEV